MLPGEVRANLHAAVVGRRLFFYPETDSTNDLAVAGARGGEPEGSVYYTDFQRRGRGRQGHRWVSAAGNGLLFSVVLRPGGTLPDVLPVTLAVSLALAVGLSKATGADVGVKWPNDLVTAVGKVGGILAESGADDEGRRFVVVGVGINVNDEARDFPAPIRGRAVSCRMLAGGELDRATLLGDLLTVFDTYYARFRVDGFGAFVSSYQGRMLLSGKRVHFERDGRDVGATVTGVAADGALRVVPDGATEEVRLFNETVEAEG